RIVARQKDDLYRTLTGETVVDPQDPFDERKCNSWTQRMVLVASLVLPILPQAFLKKDRVRFTKVKQCARRDRDYEFAFDVVRQGRPDPSYMADGACSGQPTRYRASAPASPHSLSDRSPLPPPACASRT